MPIPSMLNNVICRDWQCMAYGLNLGDFLQRVGCRKAGWGGFSVIPAAKGFTCACAGTRRLGAAPTLQQGLGGKKQWQEKLQQ